MNTNIITESVTFQRKEEKYTMDIKKQNKTGEEDITYRISIKAGFHPDFLKLDAGQLAVLLEMIQEIV